MRTEFTSKRNQVIFVQEETTYIEKCFLHKEDMEREVLYLEIMKDSYCPKVLDEKENTLYLSYLPGKLLLDWFIELENKQESADELITLLIDTLSIFYEKTKEYFGVQHILGDIHFRNFIINNKHLYLLDLEQCGEGAIEQDIGKLMAYAISYEPVHTSWKKDFVEIFRKRFCEAFSLNEDRLNKHYNQELQDIKMRRKER